MSLVCRGVRLSWPRYKAQRCQISLRPPANAQCLSGGRATSSISDQELNAFQAARLDPDVEQLAIWGSPRYWLTLRTPFDFDWLSQVDTYLRDSGVWHPINWHNLQGHLKHGVAVPLEREELFYVLSPRDDPGLDPKCFEDPTFVRWDHRWLLDVTDFQVRTTEGIDKGKARALAALPPLEELKPEEIRIRPAEGVRPLKAMTEFVKLDGQGIRRNKRWKWVLRSDARTLATPEQIGDCLVEESFSALRIAHDAAEVRLCRDLIGDIIEALRREPAIGLEAEVDGRRQSVEPGAKRVKAGKRRGQPKLEELDPGRRKVAVKARQHMRNKTPPIRTWEEFRRREGIAETAKTLRAWVKILNREKS